MCWKCRSVCECVHFLMYIECVGVCFLLFIFFALPGDRDTVSTAQCGCQGRRQCESREKRLGHSSCQRAWELQKTIPWRACESECVHKKYNTGSSCEVYPKMFDKN